MFCHSGWICAGNKTKNIEEEKKGAVHMTYRYVSHLFLKG